MYEYRARCIRVVDGDTFDLCVDVGFHMTATCRFRLLGVNAYEMNSSDEVGRVLALQAKELAQITLMTGKEWPLVIRTQKADSFGRWLAEVEYSDNGAMRSFSQLLLEKKLAVPFQK